MSRGMPKPLCGCPVGTAERGIVLALWPLLSGCTSRIAGAYRRIGDVYPAPLNTPEVHIRCIFERSLQLLHRRRYFGARGLDVAVLRDCTVGLPQDSLDRFVGNSKRVKIVAKPRRNACQPRHRTRFGHERSDDVVAKTSRLTAGLKSWRKWGLGGTAQRALAGLPKTS